MTDATLMSKATSGAFDPTEPDFDPTDLDRVAASLEALALTFGVSNAKQDARRRHNAHPQHVDGVALAA